MRSALVLLAACAHATHPASAPVDRVTIAFEVPAAGARWHEVRESAFSADDARRGHIEELRRVDKRIDLLAIDHGVVTAERVEYAMDRSASSVAGQSAAHTSALEGKTYRIGDGGVHGDDGSAIADDVAKQVAADAPLGRFESKLEQFLDGRTFVVGAKVAVPPDALSDLTHGYDNATVQIVLRALRGGHAAFDLAIAMSQTNGDDLATTIAVELSGKIDVDLANGVVVGLALSGTTRMDGPDPMQATQTFDDQRTMEP